MNNINTKFDIGQKIWLLRIDTINNEHCISKRTIKAIFYQKDCIAYFFEEDLLSNLYNEQWCFATKEEAEQEFNKIKKE